MFSLLAISLAVTAVSAQYGTSNDAPSGGSYPSYPVYYPPVIYDSSSSSESRERHHRKCPKLQTYLGALPGIPEEAFYPPVIRYARFGRQETALVVCDRDPTSTNILFARRNSSRDIRTAHIASVGSTAGLTLSCNRRERRYIGSVLNFTNAPTFSSEIEITQFVCLGLDKVPIIGLVSEALTTSFAEMIAIIIRPGPIIDTRRKRAAEETTVASVSEAAATQAGSTEAAATVAAVTEAAATEAAVTEAAAAAATEAAVTQAAAAETASEASIASIDLTDGLSKEEAALVKDPKTAITVALANLAKVLGTIL